MTVKEKQTLKNQIGAMQDIYTRLQKIGFEAGFLRRAVLPDWWDDSLGGVPANRAVAEISIARHLGLTVSKLRDPRADLTPPTLATARLKTNKNVRREQVAPAMWVAQHAAELTVKHVTELRNFGGRLSATEVRKIVLKHHAAVNLESLTTFCWAHGLAVLHVKVLPQLSKKLDGMALFCGKIPVIVLASAKDSPPWLAFHLGHELGHILLGHVKEGMGPWVDGSIDSLVGDQHEKDADEFACEVLSGQKELGFKAAYGMTASRLATAVQQYGARHGIAPGVVALIYGRSANRWGPAQLALKLLREDIGAHEILDRALSTHLCPDELSESTARFLSILQGPGRRTMQNAPTAH